MQSFRNTVLLNLRIIAKVQPHDKLAWDGLSLSIEKRGLLQAVWRWAAGRSRSRTVEILHSVFMHAQGVLREEKREDVKATFVAAMHEALGGVQTLAQSTYADDEKVAEALKVLITNVQLSLK